MTPSPDNAMAVPDGRTNTSLDQRLDQRPDQRRSGIVRFAQRLEPQPIQLAL